MYDLPRDKWLGGELALNDLSTLRWRKTWFLPGLTDAATRIETRAAIDLRSGRPDAQLKLGLRRLLAPPGARFVHGSHSAELR